MNRADFAGTAHRYLNRILVLISAPLLSENSDSETGFDPVLPLSAEREATHIYHSLVDSNCNRALVVERDVATRERLIQQLSRASAPLAIHFAGHGEPHGIGIALIVENEVGLAEDLTASELSDILLALHRPPCAIAVLASCYSERLAETLLQAGVQHIIAINANERVLDEACRTFAQHFYPTLFQIGDIRTAFATARAAVKADFEQRSRAPENSLAALYESLKFRHVSAPRARYTIELEDGSEAAALSHATQFNIDSVSPDPFIGRQLMLHKLALAFKNEDAARLIHLKAMGGMGKTAVAYASARWHLERNRYPDGVWKVELRNVTSADQLITDLVQLPPLAGQAPGLKLGDLLQLINSQRHLFILDDLDSLLANDCEGTIRVIKALMGLRYCRILTTSRSALPMELDHKEIQVEKLDEAEAIEVFRRYADPENIDLRTESARAAFHNVLEYLDGYAFPIRLAARYHSRRHCSFEELASVLSDKPSKAMHTLDRSTRENSLYATLDATYAVLSSSACEALHALAVFPGGLSEGAAVALDIAGEIGAFEELDHYSMSEVLIEGGGHRRFQLPDPARDYVDQKRPSNLIRIYGPRLLNYMLSVFSDVDVPMLALLMSDEKRNVYMLLEYALQISEFGPQLLAVQLVVLLAPYWLGAGGAELERGLSLLMRANEVARARNDKALVASCTKCLGDYAQFKGDNAEAIMHYSAAVETYLELGHAVDAAYIQGVVGAVLMRLNRFDDAAVAFGEAAALYSRANEPTHEADMLWQQASVLLSLGEVRWRDGIDVLLLAAKVLRPVSAIRSAEMLWSAGVALMRVSEYEALCTLNDAYALCPDTQYSLRVQILETLIVLTQPGEKHATLVMDQALAHQVLQSAMTSSMLYEQAGDEFYELSSKQAVTSYEAALELIGSDLEARDRIINKLILAANLKDEEPLP